MRGDGFWNEGEQGKTLAQCGALLSTLRRREGSTGRNAKVDGEENVHEGIQGPIALVVHHLKNNPHVQECLRAFRILDELPFDKDVVANRERALPSIHLPGTPHCLNGVPPAHFARERTAHQLTDGRSEQQQRILRGQAQCGRIQSPRFGVVVVDKVTVERQVHHGRRPRGVAKVPFLCGSPHLQTTGEHGSICSGKVRDWSRSRQGTAAGR